MDIQYEVSLVAVRGWSWAPSCHCACCRRVCGPRVLSSSHRVLSSPPHVSWSCRRPTFALCCRWAMSPCRRLRASRRPLIVVLTCHPHALSSCVVLMHCPRVVLACSGCVVVVPCCCPCPVSSWPHRCWSILVLCLSKVG